jgi:hypothetical protein
VREIGDPHIGRTPEPLRIIRSRSRGPRMPDGVARVNIRVMHSDSPDTPEPVRKLHELEHTADVGEDDRTPLILIGEVWIVAAIAVGVILAISLFAFRVAS